MHFCFKAPPSIPRIWTSVPCTALQTTAPERRAPRRGRKASHSFFLEHGEHILLRTQEGQFTQIFDYCFYFHCFVSSLGTSEILKLALPFLSSIAIIHSHTILVKSPCTFPLHSGRDYDMCSPLQCFHWFLSTLQFTASMWITIQLLPF